MNFLPALLQTRCPQCRKGFIFKSSAYDLPHYTEMHENCPHCDLKFEKEIGFFYGAMFISYALNVAVVVSVFMAVYVLLGNPDLWIYITSILIMTFALLPLNFRYSRALMLYLFGGIKYQKGI